jgi:hypothetical protein
MQPFFGACFHASNKAEERSAVVVNLGKNGSRDRDRPEGREAEQRLPQRRSPQGREREEDRRAKDDRRADAFRGAKVPRVLVRELLLIATR